MILIRAALIKVLQSVCICALALGVLACFLLSYSYISGDRQDRAEMVATAENAIHFFQPTSNGRRPASAASLASEQ